MERKRETTFSEILKDEIVGKRRASRGQRDKRGNSESRDGPQKKLNDTKPKQKEVERKRGPDPINAYQVTGGREKVVPGSGCENYQMILVSIKKHEKESFSSQKRSHST